MTAGLPPATERFTRFVTTAQLDWSNTEAAIEYLVEYSRVLAGGQRPFDEAAVRELVRRDVARARDFAAARNHDILPEGVQSHRSLASISAPTLVIHASADPMFPLEHGRALADEIPAARLLTLQGAGHGVERADWPAIVAAIAEHTTARDRASRW